MILDASRRPTSPSSARSCAQRAQHSAKMVPTWSQKLPKMEAVRWGTPPLGVKMAKKTKNNIDPTKNRGLSISVAPCWPKKWPTWSQLGPPKNSQNRTKMGSIRRTNLRHMPTQQKKGLSPTDPPHFGRKSGQHGPNLVPKMEPRWPKHRFKHRSQEASTKMIDCWIDFWTILAPFCDPSWDHVGDIFGKKEAAG